MRRQLLEQLYDKMSDEDKRLFVQFTMLDKDHNEIMQALCQQKDDIEYIKHKQNWVVDFGSDVAANLFTDSLLWIGSKIFRSIK